jgi:predicted nicotinamide N-methyase
MRFIFFSLSAIIILLVEAAVDSSMLKRVVISFNRHDQVEKISVSEQVLESYEFLKSFLKQKFEDILLSDFDIEVYDETSSRYVEFAPQAQQDMGNLKRFIIIERNDKKDGYDSNALRICGRKYYEPKGGYEVKSFRLLVHEVDNANAGTGFTLWDGAIILAKYFELNSTIIQQKSVLELGAGTGFTGMAVSMLGAERVLLTDLPYLQENLRSNVQSNFDPFTVNRQVISHSRHNLYHEITWDPSLENTTVILDRTKCSRFISTGVLDWFDHRTYPYFYPNRDESDAKNFWDIVVASDVVWLEHLVPSLVATLRAVCGPDTVVYLSHQV